METLQNKVKWQVSLSNGETFFEGKNEFVRVAGELSPWNKLLAYISENNLNITSISLYTDEGETFNIPSVGKTPKFHAFSEAEKPVSLNFFRKAAKDVVGQTAFEQYAVIEATFESIKLQLWVDESEGKNSWALVLPS